MKIKVLFSCSGHDLGSVWNNYKGNQKPRKDRILSEF